MKRLILFVVVFVILPGLTPLHAQENALHQVYPASMRYSVAVPTAWHTQTEACSSLGLPFVGETLCVAETVETVEAWQSREVIGPLLQIDLLTSQILGLSSEHIIDEQELLTASLDVIGEGEIALSVINGYQAATQPIAFDGAEVMQTLIIADGLLYRVSYAAPDQAQLALLEDVIASFAISDAEKLAMGERTPWKIYDDTLTVPVEPGWLLLRWTMNSAPYGIAFNDGAYYVALPAPTPASLDLLLTNPAGTEQTHTHAGETHTHTVHAYTMQLTDPVVVIGVHPRASLTVPQRETLVIWANQLQATVVPDDILLQQDSLVPLVSADLSRVFDEENEGMATLMQIGDRYFTVTIAGPSTTWQENGSATAATIMNGLDIVFEQTSPAVGDAAPEFSTQLLSGETVALSDYYGQIVILSFWATWCRPCHEELPAFQEAFAQRDDVTVLAVNYREADFLIEEFATLHDLTFPIAVDRAGAVSVLYGVQAYPSNYVIDREGIVHRIPRFDSQDGVEGILRWLDGLDDQ